MGKYWGIVLIVGAVSLTACSAPAATDAPTASPSAGSSVAPLHAAPTESGTPTPSASAPASASSSLPPEFYDDSARGKYLAGVKKALNAWRDGVVPSDVDLLKGAEVSCGLFAQGKTHTEIGAMGGTTSIARDNASAVAIYASRFLCTKYNTDNL